MKILILLKKLCPFLFTGNFFSGSVWNLIVTHVSNYVTSSTKNYVTLFVTNGTSWNGLFYFSEIMGEVTSQFISFFTRDDL